MPPDDKSSDLPATPSIPFWALPLVQQVAEIRALTASIPKIEREMDELQKSVVPISEHKRLMERQDTLWDLSQTVMPEWRQRKTQVDEMWADRQRQQGSIRMLKLIGTLLAVLQGIVIVALALGQAGVSLHVGR